MLWYLISFLPLIIYIFLGRKRGLFRLLNLLSMFIYLFGIFLSGEDVFLPEALDLSNTLVLHASVASCLVGMCTAFLILFLLELVLFFCGVPEPRRFYKEDSHG